MKDVTKTPVTELQNLSKEEFIKWRAFQQIHNPGILQARTPYNLTIKYGLHLQESNVEKVDPSLLLSASEDECRCDSLRLMQKGHEDGCKVKRYKPVNLFR